MPDLTISLYTANLTPIHHVLPIREYTWESDNNAATWKLETKTVGIQDIDAFKDVTWVVINTNGQPQVGKVNAIALDYHHGTYPTEHGLPRAYPTGTGHYTIETKTGTNPELSDLIRAVIDRDTEPKQAPTKTQWDFQPFQELPRHDWNKVTCNT
ncbi:UNVERIFIED_ORG: hypothetical protein M2328_005784 [Rhodococcus erythropolis]